MMRSGFLALSVVAAAGLLSGCVPPAPPLVAYPLVAYPGQDKTVQVVQEDDAACRQQAAAPAPAPVPAAPVPASGSAPAPAPAVVPAETVYLRCMAARGNVVGAAPVVRIVAPPPPVYYDPLWGDPFWPGYYASPFFTWRAGWGGY